MSKIGRLGGKSSAGKRGSQASPETRPAEEAPGIDTQEPTKTGPETSEPRDEG
jgi:hypothetical protein